MYKSQRLWFRFLSSRTTVTAGAVPTNDFSGTNVTVPSAATVYVPTPSTVLVVEPSSKVAGTASLISTVFSTPSTVTVPPLNSGYLLSSTLNVSSF